MNKERLLREICCLVESKRLWEEMSEHIFALGGELWETKYSEAYLFHEELVFHLLEDFLNKKLTDISELEFFGECIYDLSQRKTINFTLPDGNERIYISNPKELLEYYISYY